MYLAVLHLYINRYILKRYELPSFNISFYHPCIFKLLLIILEVHSPYTSFSTAWCSQNVEFTARFSYLLHFLSRILATDNETERRSGAERFAFWKQLSWSPESARCTVMDLLSTFTSLYNSRVREMCARAGGQAGRRAQCGNSADCGMHRLQLEHYLDCCYRLHQNAGISTGIYILAGTLPPTIHFFLFLIKFHYSPILPLPPSCTTPSKLCF